MNKKQKEIYCNILDQLLVALNKNKETKTKTKNRQLTLYDCDTLYAQKKNKHFLTKRRVQKEYFY